MTTPDKSAKNRVATYDVLKGIAIIMMVALHARAPYCARHFGALFLMPVFFILAGWFFDFKYAETAASCIRYTKKRFRRLWWPMFFWGLNIHQNAKSYAGERTC